MSSSSPAGGRLLVDEPAPGVARLTISNPGKRGALDHAILDGFARTLAGLEARCVIITGEHATFSAGYDLGDLSAAVLADEAERLVAHPFTAAIDAIEAVPVPDARGAQRPHDRWWARARAVLRPAPRRRDDRSSGCRQAGSGSSTRTPAYASSSTRSARPGRASCSCRGAGSTRAPHARGASSTRSRSPSGSRPKRSRWRSRSPPTRHWRSAATSW